MNLKENMVIYINVNYLIKFSKNIDKINTRFILVSGSGDYTNPYDFF